MKTMWAVYDDGLRVWANGNLVATIPEQDFSHLIAEIAQCKRYQIDDGPNLIAALTEISEVAGASEGVEWYKMIADRALEGR